MISRWKRIKRLLHQPDGALLLRTRQIDSGIVLFDLFKAFDFMANSYKSYFFLLQNKYDFFMLAPKINPMVCNVTVSYKFFVIQTRKFFFVNKVKFPQVNIFQYIERYE